MHKNFTLPGVVSLCTYTQSGASAGNVTVTFSPAASGAYAFTLTRGSLPASVVANTGNIAAASPDEISVPAGNVNSRRQYQFTDDLSAVSGTVFTYRLKMIDTDGQFKYSNVIMIRTESNNIKGITLNPNPVINGMATARFTASAAGSFDFNVLDLSDRIILRQHSKAVEGNNSVSLNGLDRLPRGMYVLKMISRDELHAVKLVVAR
ncbi:MAG: hypothetical protein WDO16_00740 [Bacteroidota bacterium]